MSSRSIVGTYLVHLPLLRTNEEEVVHVFVEVKRRPTGCGRETRDRSDLESVGHETEEQPLSQI